MLVTAERRQIEGLKHSLAAEADRRRDEAQHLRQLYARQLQALRHRQMQEVGPQNRCCICSACTVLNTTWLADGIPGTKRYQA